MSLALYATSRKCFVDHLSSAVKGAMLNTKLIFMQLYCRVIILFAMRYSDLLPGIPKTVLRSRQEFFGALCSGTFST